jgi:RNA polymerase sigma factor (sigma-70 family)
MESAKIIATVARMVRDVGLAEELAQDALVAALEQWPGAGVPDNPAAWLTQVAKHRALDRLRHGQLAERKAPEIGRELDAQHEMAQVDFAEAVDAALDDDIGDDLLRLVFTACHPVLSTEARVALTLRLMGGLTTDEIARAFLVPEATVAQRIVRAKRTLLEARVPFEVPRRHELQARLASVLEVLYLIFNEGYSATAGDDWMRPALCDEAMRLGRIVAGLVPDASEVHGLVALMEIQASRTAARVGASGEPVLLLEQNRARWDQMLIRRGLAGLARAEALGALGPYALQAAIAACHGRARTADETDWPRIAALYDALAELAPSPIVELNRAVALSMAFGPAAGLEVVDALMDEPALKGYHLLPTVRGDLLFKLGRHDEARREFDRAASLTRNTREQALLRARARACTASGFHCSVRFRRRTGQPELVPRTAQLRVGAEARQLRRPRDARARRQRQLRRREPQPPQIGQRRHARMLHEEPREVPRRGVGDLGHPRHAPVGLRLFAHGVLHAVQRGVQVVAVGEKGRELGVVRAAPQRHHHRLRHLGGERFAADLGDAVQHEVDAGRDARAAVERRIDHEHAVAHHVAARLDRAQFVQVVVVRGGATSREHAGMRRQHRARADRDQLDAAALEALAAQPVQQVLRLGVVDGDGVAGQADQHHPGRAAPLRGQGREPGERDADRGDGRRPRACELDREALGLARRLQPLVRDAQRLGRPGPVEHQAAGEQHEDYADGWLVLWVHA